MKVKLDIPEDLYKQLEARAAAKGITFNEAVLQAIRQWLALLEQKTDAGR